MPMYFYYYQHHHQRPLTRVAPDRLVLPIVQAGSKTDPTTNWRIAYGSLFLRRERARLGGTASPTTQPTPSSRRFKRVVGPGENPPRTPMGGIFFLPPRRVGRMQIMAKEKKQGGEGGKCINEAWGQQQQRLWIAICQDRSV